MCQVRCKKQGAGQEGKGLGNLMKVIVDRCSLSHLDMCLQIQILSSVLLGCGWASMMSGEDWKGPGSRGGGKGGRRLVGLCKIKMCGMQGM